MPIHSDNSDYIARADQATQHRDDMDYRTRFDVYSPIVKIETLRDCHPPPPPPKESFNPAVPHRVREDAPRHHDLVKNPISVLKT